MTGKLLIAGGGIGGLSAALAARRAGWQALVFEQAASFSEVGAGLQLGPNATRILRQWGLLDDARAMGCEPERLVARDATTGRELSSLPLGLDFHVRYDAPYLTLHRSDLHGLLLSAVRDQGVVLHTDQQVTDFAQDDQGVRLHIKGVAGALEGDALLGADGLWSPLRQQLLGDPPARASDHVAYRGMAPMAALSTKWHAPEVTVWLAPGLHVVTYPVQAGHMLNIVCVTQHAVEGESTGWDNPATRERVLAALAGVWPGLRELPDVVPRWGSWVLHDRPPVASPAQMARGRVALLGDAAHPMRPYLAQGAAMAIEDAAELGRSLLAVAQREVDMPAALQAYAQARWQRVAHVQRRALRNGAIFHASGPVRLARNLALRGLGARLMDQPWLYGASPG